MSKKLSAYLAITITLTAIAIFMVFANISISSRGVTAAYLCLIPVVVALTIKVILLDRKLRKIENSN